MPHVWPAAHERGQSAAKGGRVMTCPAEFPDGRFVCELDANHGDTWHQSGAVRWGGGSEVDDTSKGDKGHG